MEREKESARNAQRPNMRDKPIYTYIPFAPYDQRAQTKNPETKQKKSTTATEHIRKKIKMTRKEKRKFTRWKGALKLRPHRRRKEYVPNGMNENWNMSMSKLHLTHYLQPFVVLRCSRRRVHLSRSCPPPKSPAEWIFCMCVDWWPRKRVQET